MASEFIGFKITVTLTSPPNGKLQGIVANVVGQQLFLRDVHVFWSNQRFQSYVVDSTHIADLEVTPDRRDENTVPTPAAPSHTNSAQWGTAQTSELSGGSFQAHISSIQPTAQAFVDPAILSYAKPNLDTRGSLPVARPHTRSPVMIGDSATTSIPTTVGMNQTQEPVRLNPIAATLQEPFNSLALGNVPPKQVQDDTQSISNVKAMTKKNKRATSKHSTGNEVSQTVPGIIDVKDLKTSPIVNKKLGRGKGWRQTPIIEEGTTSKSRHKKNKKSLVEDLNGWATEDATDIQDMGDFDFESNLSKFDKRQVFDDIRSKDKTADEDRLVSHNRKARPGTNGGKNLHYTENVLDPPETSTQWKSEAGETEDEVREERYSSSRTSRREHSKAGRAPTARKGSAIINQNLPTTIMSRTGSTRTESPHPTLVRVGTTSSPMNGGLQRSTFRMADTNKPCTTVSPLQMLEIEQVCTSELGLTEDMLTENAARGISEAALKYGNISVPSGNILVLAGNHKSGARAIAAARHLRNRNMRVSVCALGGEREDILLESLRRQLDIYKRGGGRCVTWDEFQSRISDWSPHLIVDALLGMHVAFEELRLDQQASTFEMIRWMNRSSVHIFSVDVPSGLNASTGEITETDSGPLLVNSTSIICLGAPKGCLLDAMARDEDLSTWRVCVADIGIGTAAWKKYGTRRRHGVDFGKHWLLELTYQA
ncbi:putative n domain protein [Phaeomoniella chlamydospora]|uniref:Enhancer of mRNA-decapping protein 3 n=1 Tax=Phaeomoniella chlamydospora TaxID=158046 RepID=A0A0G2E8S8_PHACM|nr:putative n domain protein [Phaeomoniella chlamydospora]